MSFYSFYPPVGAGGNASIGVNGNPAPTSSTEVGGIDPSGNLSPLQTDASGNLKVDIASASGSPIDVNVVSSVLPTGAATEAKQDDQIVQETAIANSVASIDISTQSIDTNTASIDTNTAATATSVDSIDTKTVHVDTNNVTIVSSTLPTGAATSANQTNGNQITQITGTVPLPTGAATAALQTSGNASLTSIDSKLTSPLAVTGPLTDTQLRATPVPVSGTVTAANASVSTTGAAVPGSATMVGGSDGTNLRAVKVSAAGVVAVDASGTTVNTNLQTIAGATTLVGNGTTGTGSQRVTIASDNANIPANITQFGTTNISTGTGASGAGIPRVTVANDSNILASQSGTWTVQIGNTPNTTPILVKESVSATATNSNVASSASSVTLLASNANRLGATIFNDSTATLYVNLAGNTASTTNYTVQLVASAYYELPTPHLYTGTITGIWASATGNARVTELS